MRTLSAADIFSDENMSTAMNLVTTKKRKRIPTDQGVTDAKRSSLADTNANGNHVNGASNNEFNSDSSANDFSTQLQPTSNDGDISSTAAAALNAHLTVPGTQDLSFVSSGTGTDDRQLDDSFAVGDALRAADQASAYVLTPFTSSSEQVATAREQSNGTSQKPQVGTEEWHKIRRDNHKEVERRRRETINEGINELAKIVPGCEKNKGSILARAVEYINDLKAKVDELGGKKVMENNVLETAVSELMARNDQMRAELQRVLDENMQLKQKLAEAEAEDDEEDEEEEEEAEVGGGKGNSTAR